MLINTSANAIGKIKEIDLNKNGSIDRLIVKYKGDKNKYSVRPDRDDIQVIQIVGLWEIIKWYFL